MEKLLNLQFYSPDPQGLHPHESSEQRVVYDLNTYVLQLSYNKTFIDFEGPPLHTDPYHKAVPWKSPILEQGYKDISNLYQMVLELSGERFVSHSVLLDDLANPSRLDPQTQCEQTIAEINQQYESPIITIPVDHPSLEHVFTDVVRGEENISLDSFFQAEKFIRLFYQAKDITNLENVEEIIKFLKDKAVLFVLHPGSYKGQQLKALKGLVYVLSHTSEFSSIGEDGIMSLVSLVYHNIWQDTHGNYKEVTRPDFSQKMMSHFELTKLSRRKESTKIESGDKGSELRQDFFRVTCSMDQETGQYVTTLITPEEQRKLTWHTNKTEAQLIAEKYRSNILHLLKSHKISSIRIFPLETLRFIDAEQERLADAIKSDPKTVRNLIKQGYSEHGIKEYFLRKNESQVEGEKLKKLPLEVSEDQDGWSIYLVTPSGQRLLSQYKGERRSSLRFFTYYRRNLLMLYSKDKELPLDKIPIEMILLSNGELSTMKDMVQRGYSREWIINQLQTGKHLREILAENKQ